MCPENKPANESLLPWANELEALQALNVETLQPLDRALLATFTADLRDSMWREAERLTIVVNDETSATEAERLAIGFGTIHDTAVSSNERAERTGKCVT